MSPENVKSTVRQRKKTQASSAQRFLPIAEIRNDTVLLKNGGMRAILLVEAINFNLKSEAEQQGIIAGYQSFVNTLTFPIQIVIRSARLNIDPYLSQLRTIASMQQNELLRNQTVAYASFVEHLVDVADIMQKHFYIVVPMDTSTHKKTFLEKFFEWMHQDDTVARASQRNREFLDHSKELQDSIELISTGLENIGLKTRRVLTHELVELYYQIYNPKTAQEQHLPEEEHMHIEHTVL
ncbi:MAG: hypothetical protein Q7R81_03925 [Candidatus Peregrinibacteria bacterium]|nr:hypothetical protein [Candidatus Peregrinibacteria bacterium]